MITKIKKRDGRIVDFNREKITEAIWKAAQSVGGTDRQMAEKISGQVASTLEVFFKSGKEIPTVEQIQDLVEKILMGNGHARTAKAYILYRQKHAELREQKEDILGRPTDTKFSVNAIKVLEQRYLLRDDEGK
ncbi:MAG TPA: ATP cone domain-containing protein, partial [Candidatus Sulfotelmatobacter sp.]|nr:ATP cone domain-containing protein [Candidatus Sulfotelmatobacter sp.]